MAKKKTKRGAKGKRFPFGLIILWLVVVLETIWLASFMYSTGSPIPSVYTDMQDEKTLEGILGVGLNDNE